MITCPKCDHNIVEEDNVNYELGLIKCPNCSLVFKPSEVDEVKEKIAFNPSTLPKGAWYQNEMGVITFGVSTRGKFRRTLKGFLFFIVSGYFVINILSFSSWHIINLIIICCVVYLPCHIAFICLWSALMSIIGKIEIKVNDQGGTIFKGIGIFGRVRHFSWNQVSSISPELNKVKNNDQTVFNYISLEGTDAFVKQQLIKKKSLFLLEALTICFLKVRSGKSLS